MSKKPLSYLLIILGIVMILIFISADLLGLGGDLNSFGWKQITGTAVGLLILLTGIWLIRKKDQEQ